MISVYIVSLYFFFLGLAYIYGRRIYNGTLERMGIPVVHYTNIVLGSIPDLYRNVGGIQDVEWMNKYGKVFGVYEGRQPLVYVCDPELVRLITVKDADSFNGKREWDFGDPVMNEMPAFLPADKWKIVRSLATPALSSAKLKLMQLPMRAATEDFIADIKDQIDQSENGVLEKFAIDQAVHTMLTDLISRALFSIQISGRSDKNNEFSQIVKEALTPAEPRFGSKIAMYTHAFPILRKLFRQPIFKPEPVQKFVQLFKQMLAERRTSGEQRNDLVDMCLEWWDKLDSPEFKQANITELTLLGQVLVFFVAAQDQLSTMIATVIFHMTQDPELERRIYKEVDKVFKDKDLKEENIEEEQLSTLTLLNSCISESLRLYGVFHRIERICTKDWKNKEHNLDLKQGTVVVIPIWALNRNEEWVENPEQFDPERFLPKNKDKLNPFATTGFGFGPRNCTGKWFASLVMPLILAGLLKELKFNGREDTRLEFLPGGLLMTPHEPIFVNVEKRKEPKKK